MRTGGNTAGDVPTGGLAEIKTVGLPTPGIPPKTLTITQKMGNRRRSEIWRERFPRHARGNRPLRDLARAFSAPPAQATPVETSTVAAAEAEAPPAVPEPPPAGPSPTASPVAPPAGQVAGAVAMESSPASGTNSPPPATAAPAPAPAGNPAPMAEAATESLPSKAGAKLILKAPSKDWMLKAEKASEAMQGVDMREAKNLSEDDIRTLQELQQTVGDLLRM